MKWVAVALIVAATPAAAQVQRCGPEFGKWVCRTEQPRQQPDVMDAARRGYENSQRAFDDLAASRAAEAERRRQYEVERDAQSARITAAAAEGRRQEIRRQVGEHVAAGRCNDAKAVALQEGDLDLAEQASRLCVAN